MKRFRRIIGRAFWLSFLASLGMVVFLKVRNTPRCTITGPFHPVHLTPDGSQLATLTTSQRLWLAGPVKVWNTSSGEIDREFLSDPACQDISLLGRGFQMSPDGRYAAVSLGHRALRLMDLHTGEEWPVDQVQSHLCFRFSPKGKWLCVVSNVPPGTVMVDPQTRSVRLHLEDDDKLVGFSLDERWAFSHEWTNPTGIRIWEVMSGRKAAVIKAAPENPVPWANAGPIVSWFFDVETNPDKARRFRIEALDPKSDCWSLSAGVKRFADVGVWSVGARELIFSPAKQTVATWLIQEARASQLEMLDAHDGHKLWEIDVTCAHEGKFAPDGTLFLIVHGEKQRTATMLDVLTGRKLWERPAADLGSGESRFAGGSDVVLHEDGASPIQILDARTGQPMASLPFGANASVVPTSDTRYFVLRGWQFRDRAPYFWEVWLENLFPKWFADGEGISVVVEAGTGRELFRLNCNSNSCLLSEDATTLVTVDRIDETGPAAIRIWDVRPQRAWTWAVATMIGAALGLLIVRSLYRQFRPRSAPANVRKADLPPSGMRHDEMLKA